MKKILITLGSVFVVAISMGCKFQQEKTIEQDKMVKKEEIINQEKTVKLEVEQTSEPHASQDTTELQTIPEVKESTAKETVQTEEALIDETVEQLTEKVSDKVVEQQESDEVEISTIKGNISTNEQVSLPADAVVTVILEDISLTDAPAKVISQQAFSMENGKKPFDFELNFDPNIIKEARKYGVRVRIEIDGQLRFTTNKIYSVINDDNNTKVIDIQLFAV